MGDRDRLQSQWGSKSYEIADGATFILDTEEVFENITTIRREMMKVRRTKLHFDKLSDDPLTQISFLFLLTLAKNMHLYHLECKI